MAISGLAIFNPANGTNYTVGRSRNIDRITVHHMAGVMSSSDCARVFQTPNREASAHYGIGVSGDISCYVDEDNTAWSDANWDSNCRTISIEVSNKSTGGDWPVSEASWSALVKLVRDIANRNGLLPLSVGNNLFGHRDFAATTCPGDYLYSRLQALADAVNGYAGDSTTSTTPSAQGGQDLNAVADAVIRGDYGNGSDREVRLRAAGYDPATVQAIVNSKLGFSYQPVSFANLDSVADAVIRGDYGNGADREAALRAAGYDPSAVQALVNQKLGFTGSTATTSADGAIRQGDRVQLTNWIDYNGTPLVKTRNCYFVSELNGDRAVLNADYINGPVYAAVNTNNLRKA